ncbi:hypothetical protein [Streptomyces sp. CNQ085]|uniref:non-homologous end-joining DNA ligase LigD n=1 Tax=Streptomyces sp. CNQ085 TaxID=2886944 RepID=UPI0027E44B4C|nr:hypothetical protein [Streptomyces sp. CNQ085]
MCSAPLRPDDSRVVAGYAERLAREAAEALPDLVVDQVSRQLREGKLFIDHGQNPWTRTAAAPYPCAYGRIRPSPPW